MEMTGLHPMPKPPPSLGWALLASLLLHAAAVAILGAPPLSLDPARMVAQLEVRLREPAPVPPPAPPRAPEAAALPVLKLPKDIDLHASAARPAPAAPRVLVSPRRDGRPRGLEGEAARSAYRQMEHALLYPREAVAQGIEGEATVLLFLDERGDAIAARLEASSGHALLDEAAVRAARSLRALPASAPREALLPVRFRLR
jgi:protein TonB